MNQETKPKRTFNPQIAEYFVGLSLLIKGYEELPHFNHYPFSIGFIFFAGIFIIIGTRFHHHLEKRIRHSGGLFHVLEGLVEIITAIILFQGLKKMIPFFLAFIGLVYVALGVVEHFETDANRQVLRPRLRFWL